MYPTDTPTPETAILVGVQKADQPSWELTYSLNELALLADTAGAHVADRLTQALDRPNPATFLGKGKVQELKRLVAARHTDTV